MQSRIHLAAPVVHAIEAERDPRYDLYVRACPRASPYQLGAWGQILRSGYGFKPTFLATGDESGRLSGVMPLMYTRGLVSGRRMRSLPVVPTGGPLADSFELEAELVATACRVTDERAKQLDFTSRTPGYEDAVPGLRRIERHPTWITPLPADPDELLSRWKKRSNNLFRNIRKAAKAGLTVREGTELRDLVAFYRLYLVTMKRHRSLPRAWRQMVCDRELLGRSGVFRVFVAEHDGRPVAAALFHALGETVDLLYNGSDESKRDLRPNFALYWHVLGWAIARGFARFDWGPAQEGGTLSRFKSQWSAEPVPEYGYRYAVGGHDGSTRADRLRHQHDRLDVARSTNRREAVFDAIWQRAPLTLTRMVGSTAYRVF